jgi:hypothetical protein
MNAPEQIPAFLRIGILTVVDKYYLVNNHNYIVFGALLFTLSSNLLSIDTGRFGQEAYQAKDARGLHGE